MVDAVTGAGAVDCADSMAPSPAAAAAVAVPLPDPDLVSLPKVGRYTAAMPLDASSGPSNKPALALHPQKKKKKKNTFKSSKNKLTKIEPAHQISPVFPQNKTTQ